MVSSSSKELGSDTNGSGVYTSICLASLAHKYPGLDSQTEVVLKRILSVQPITHTSQCKYFPPHNKPPVSSADQYVK
jgi:hypothetical protein